MELEGTPRFLGECFLDVLRVALARRLNLRNFHRLSVVCNEQQLDRRSPWSRGKLKMYSQ